MLWDILKIAYFFRSLNMNVSSFAQNTPLFDFFYSLLKTRIFLLCGGKSCDNILLSATFSFIIRG